MSGSSGNSAVRPEPLVGVVALQGGVAEHEAAVRALGGRTQKIRTPADLAGVDALIVPGGESTVIDRLARAFGLAAPLRTAIAGGTPTLATCAGLIYLACTVVNPAPGQHTLRVLDITVRRNAFGSQRFSGHSTVHCEGGPLCATFIRAPLVVDSGSAEVVARLSDGTVVGVRQGSVTALAFHPEEDREFRFHRDLLTAARRSQQREQQSS